ncbi:endonuclease/exonuclease/phosphatase family protein [Cyclobacterium xiamenense]|uniref:endonuclease/exonuclease/phosphatase family protein n=1 Tax=Cyclobacterium xiamenense TaxID=1297121 RepID=UPI0035CFBDBC
MKLVTWNCNGALRKKFHEISTLDADIYLIQECEDPLRSNDKSYRKWSENHLWAGENKNKGIGIFASHSYTLEPLNWSDQYEDHSVKHFLPCLVNKEIQLLAVWTHHNNSPTFGYIGQFWKYLQINKDNFENIIIAGDFNSNVIWDKWDRWWNHSDCSNQLEAIGVVSAYHQLTKEPPGHEKKPTFFLQRNTDKPYHIDYFYLSKSFLTNKSKILVGEQSQWLYFSDHLPVTLEF